jgi:hypothetical protein
LTGKETESTIGSVSFRHLWVIEDERHPSDGFVVYMGNEIFGVKWRD